MFTEGEGMVKDTEKTRSSQKSWSYENVWKRETLFHQTAV